MRTASDGGVSVRVHARAHVDADGDLGGVATDRGCALVELQPGASDALGGAPVQEDPVADGARETHRPRTERRDPDRRRARGDEGEPEPLALGRRGRLAREGVTEHRDGCPEPIEGSPHRRTRADTQDQPPVRTVLHRRAGLREQLRRARREGNDAAAEQEPARLAGDPGERGEHVARTDLRHEHRPVPEGLTDPREAGQVPPRIRVAEGERGTGDPWESRHMLGW